LGSERRRSRPPCRSGRLLLRRLRARGWELVGPVFVPLSARPEPRKGKYLSACRGPPLQELHAAVKHARSKDQQQEKCRKVSVFALFRGRRRIRRVGPARAGWSSWELRRDRGRARNLSR